MSSFVDPTPAAINSLQPAFQPYAIYFINALRDAGWPAIITSGTRSAAHNAAVGGAQDSHHLMGTAFDYGVLGYVLLDQDPAALLAVGEFGEQLGLRWGGRFSSYDPGHFDTGQFALPAQNALIA